MATLVKSIFMFATTVLFFEVQAIVPVNPGHPLTVCEVLEDLAAYRGKIIEVRGEWQGGYLIDRCPPLRTGNHTWPNAILTVQPDDFMVRIQEPVNWRMDADAYNRADRDFIRAARSKEESVVKATFIGRLDARESLFLVTEGVPRPIPGGFGHLGVFPARLVINTVKDLVVSPGTRLPGVLTGDPQ